ncbi:glycosyltransferase [Leucobacter sp. W1038]|uniref:glycosyltransferase n=1 Tax=Leucobacter sp. W1038 TaxID=3438281 RepID=UPI003D995C3B
MHPIAERVWRLVPKCLQDAIASGVDRLQGVTPPPAPVPDVTKQFRVLIGPVNYAGQGYRWARALESTGVVSARNYVHTGNNPFGYSADHLVTWRTSEHSRAWQKSMLAEIERSYTHVLIEACFPILGGMFGGDVRRQVEVIRAAGVSVGVVGHGTDVRLPSSHLAQTKYSHFGAGASAWAPVDRIEQTVAENLALIADLDAPTFVSTPGLLSDLPRAHLLGVVIEPEVWATERPVLVRERPRVVHAPTQTHVKGTDLIRPVLRRLHAEGLIEYVELEGISHAAMPDVFADADIVLDQFRIGDYGVGACEAMASGRLVLTYLTAEVRAEVGAQAGMAIPIPEVTIDSLEQVMRDIVDRRQHYRDLAAQGPEYVRRLHNGDFSSTVLLREFLEK